MPSLRKSDGPLASNHGLAHRKVLLPFETQLCNELGISKEEYFEFLARAEATPVSREGYEHIPDVRNDPVTAVIVNLVIGVVLTAVSYLMQKPRQKRPEPVNVQKDSNIGQNKFTPSTDFASVQELAKLGQTVPLVFARKQDQYGGCRANALLTYSCLSSLRDSQRIKAIAVTSLAEIADAPDFRGLAIGDQLLDDYNANRVKAFYNTKGGIITDTDSYGVGSLVVDTDGKLPKMWWHIDNKHVRTFCGVRNPSSKTEFGLYSPMPNGNSWKLDFQMYILPDAAKKSEKGRVKSLRDKIESAFPLMASVASIESKSIGGIISYKMLGNDRLDTFEDYYDKKRGVQAEDIRNQVNQQRAFIDSNIQEGELYAFNQRLAVCVERPFLDYLPGQGYTSTYKFKLIDDKENSAFVEVRDPYSLEPHWEADKGQIMRFQDAVVANNQTCDCTEIGIGSTVWKRISGANINNFPGEDIIEKIEDNDAGGTYDIGRMDVYLARYSMFVLQIKPNGEGDWIAPGAVFAVKGSRPVEQFNAIRIYHVRGQHEFRLRPVPTKQMYEYNVKNKKPIYLLNSRKGLDSKDANTNWFFHNAGFEIYFEGAPIFFNDANARNPECYKGTREVNESYVTGFSQSSYTPPDASGYSKNPSSNNPRFVGEPQEDDPNKSFVVLRENKSTKEQKWAYFWNGVKVAGVTADLNNPLVGNDRIAYGSNNDRYIPRTKRYEIPEPEIDRFWFDIERQVESTVEREPKGETRIKSLRTRSGSGRGLEVEVQEYTDGSYTWNIYDEGSGYNNGDNVELSIDGYNIRFEVYVGSTEEIEKDDPGWWGEGDMYPLHAVTDYRNHDTESCSNTDRPEHRITYVNEIIKAEDELVRGTYANLSSMALIVNSSRDLDNLTQLSAYYTRGIKGYRLNRKGKGDFAAINTFPEIAYFLLTNRVTGAGAIIDENQIDIESFGRATEYCHANKFYWDGVISERINLREWLFEQASYCLLDFTMKGGRFGLEPAVPVGSDDVILVEDQAKPEIRGLFTDGNIKDMKVTTLAPEERKMFEAEVLFRKETENHFPENRTTNVRVDGYTTQAVETYDMTQFCTSRKQTVNFAKYALMLRKWVDHSIEFQTTPESMVGIEPASYIRVVSHVCHPSRFQNGSVTASGDVISSRPITDDTQIYYWRPGFTLDANTQSYIRVGKFKSAGEGKAADFLHGCVFSAVTETSTDRVYKVDSISIGEEGFVQVNATHMPLTDDGALEVMQGWTDDDGFIINDTED